MRLVGKLAYVQAALDSEGLVPGAWVLLLLWVGRKGRRGCRGGCGVEEEPAGKTFFIWVMGLEAVWKFQPDYGVSGSSFCSFYRFRLGPK